MTESREVLIDTLARVRYEQQKRDVYQPQWPEWDALDAQTRQAYLNNASEQIDAVLAHPSAVLDLLENAPCPTCGGTGAVPLHPDENARVLLAAALGEGEYEQDCDACGGSGRLGRDGLDKLRGFEQVGYFDEAGQFHRYLAKLDWHVGLPPVFARVAVPESAGEVLSDGQTGADARREQAETRATADEPTTSPAARVAVPEPSEGTPKLPADHSLCDLPCDLPDEAHDG